MSIAQHDNPKRRWRMQLRLSTVLLLVTIIAIVCGWGVDHRQLREAHNKDAAKVRILESQMQSHENAVFAAEARLKVFERAYKDRAFRRSIHDEVTGRPFDLSRAVPAR